MTQILVVLLLVTAAIISAGCGGSRGDTRPIYDGVDMRVELNTKGPMNCHAGSATAAIFHKKVFSDPRADPIELREHRDLTSRNWCADERFAEQDTQALCTGFLIAPDTLVTAGHCIADDGDTGPILSCDHALIVFDYRLAMGNTEPRFFTRSSVFRCAEVLGGLSSAIRGGPDWRVIRLDRPTGRAPLPMYTGAPIAGGAEVIVTGHPLGLPMKTTKGKTRETVIPGRSGVFKADIDTFRGNSGSPAMVQVDGRLEVIGMLISGVSDHIHKSNSGQCVRAGYCGINKDCAGGEEIIGTQPWLRWAEPGNEGEQTSRCAWCSDPLATWRWGCFQE